MNYLDQFNEREQTLIHNCTMYANFNPGGLPGHNLMIIIAKLCSILENYEKGNEKTEKKTD
jgi:hypothetical protein